MSLTYTVAEIFTSVQGEGVHTGVPMTFIRFVGCSVGKRICHHCDTDFDRTYPWRGGGEFTIDQIFSRIRSKHVCLTGGEPLNQNLEPLILAGRHQYCFHIETSGTIHPTWLGDHVSTSNPGDQRRLVLPPDTLPKDLAPSELAWVWITVAPKPGYLDSMVKLADELKVLVPGLGNGEGWPGLDQALLWAEYGKPVFLQPRNEKHRVNLENLQLCMELVLKYPSLRLSPQLHKFLSVR